MLAPAEDAEAQSVEGFHDQQEDKLLVFSAFTLPWPPRLLHQFPDLESTEAESRETFGEFRTSLFRIAGVKSPPISGRQYPGCCRRD